MVKNHRQRRAQLARRRALLGDLEPGSDRLLDPHLVAAAIDSQATHAPSRLIPKPATQSPSSGQPVRNRVQPDKPHPGGD